MKTTIYFGLVAFLLVLGCSKVDDVSVVIPGENQLKSARTATVINQTNPYLPLAEQTWDNTAELETSLWPKLATYTAPAGYPVYIAANYDVMCHFQYFSPKAIAGAVIEFTFPHIIDFVPHFVTGQKSYTYTVNNKDNITVISCTTDVIAGKNDMFCFIVKVDCGKGKSGNTTFWTDMKVNGVSVKETIKNKVFACN